MGLAGAGARLEHGRARRQLPARVEDTPTSRRGHQYIASFASSGPRPAAPAARTGAARRRLLAGAGGAGRSRSRSCESPHTRWCQASSKSPNSRPSSSCLRHSCGGPRHGPGGRRALAQVLGVGAGRLGRRAAAARHRPARRTASRSARIERASSGVGAVSADITRPSPRRGRRSPRTSRGRDGRRRVPADTPRRAAGASRRAWSTPPARPGRRARRAPCRRLARRRGRRRRRRSRRPRRADRRSS